MSSEYPLPLGPYVGRPARPPFRPLAEGMGQAVAERTILRKKQDGSYENWGDVAERVALGNASLFDGEVHSSASEYLLLKRHLANGNTLMSGRHLQHGDATQASRNLEIFCNCATSATSFLLFYLLLNGSGVGRCFSAGTSISMADGSLKPIEEIQHGDSVISWSEEVDDFVINIVEKVWKNPTRPMVKIKLENGEEIICSEDHKFMTEDGEWIKAKDLAGKRLKDANNAC